MRRAWCWLLALVLLASCNPIEYVYDELGRLIAVVETTSGGKTAVYTYDAVGNITKIEQYATSQLSVVALIPRCGPVGTAARPSLPPRVPRR